LDGKVTQTLGLSDDRLKIVVRLAKNGPVLAALMAISALSRLMLNVMQAAGLLPHSNRAAATQPVTALSLCLLAISLQRSGSAT
jgi:hypothetical protein